MGDSSSTKSNSIFGASIFEILLNLVVLAFTIGVWRAEFVCLEEKCQNLQEDLKFLQSQNEFLINENKRIENNLSNDIYEKSIYIESLIKGFHED